LFGPEVGGDVPRALNLLRPSPHYRRDLFSEGLRAVGFKVVGRIDRPEPADVLVIWNRYSGFGEMADHFERNGARVLVAENNPFGNGWRGDAWYSLAGRHVAMAHGEIRDGGPARWDSIGFELVPWRDGGREVVILGQRSIGHENVRSPAQWAERVQGRIGGRIRRHPGTEACIPLLDDLRNARAVVTWASAAAVQALAAGVPVFHDHPAFAMREACMALNAWGAEPSRDDAARLACFRRLAWAMWRHDEIRSGEAFEHLLTA
jgi:hypothetical protein